MRRRKFKRRGKMRMRKGKRRRSFGKLRIGIRR